MILFSLFFLMGDICFQWCSELPSQFLINSLIVMLLVSILGNTRISYCYLMGAFVAGFLYSYWFAASILAWSLPKELEGNAVIISGYISSLPVSDQFGSRFEFAIHHSPVSILHPEKNPDIRLSWQTKQVLHVGEQWRFCVKLKRIHGIQSPGAFDYEAWALQKGIRATGHIIASNENVLLSDNWQYYPISRLRQLIQDRLQDHLPRTATSPWLMALMIGERNNISQSDWQVLRNTGTNHLMAIAGLHIGIISGIAHYVVSWLWRCAPRLMLMMPAQEAGMIAALFAALYYSLLSGFSLPAQRASLMLFLLIITKLSRLKVHPSYILSWAMFFVLLKNPMSVLSESFVLSFGTIALIIYGMGERLHPKGLWWKWGRVQWVISFGLIPITFALYQQTSLISLIANSISIPWLAYLILPFCLLGNVVIFTSPSLSGVLLHIADISLSYLWQILSWMSGLDLSVMHLTIPNYTYFFMMLIGFLVLLIPVGMWEKWLGLIWLLPVLLYKPVEIKTGNYTLALLDVGQGLSAVVQTKHHSLIYDAGPNLGLNQDTGESVVLPFLRSKYINKIDMMVISHPDNDHIGGAASILSSIPVSMVFSSAPGKLHAPLNSYCQAGYSWQWDKVQFTFLYPDAENMHYRNDSSCVLLIDNGKQRILLPGDIEKYAENILIESIPQYLSANIIVAPHHGSKTSGTKSFIEAVHPQYVVYATGYRNRYHFPHQSVVNAYRNMNAVAFNTAETGTIEFMMNHEGDIALPAQFRVTKHKYWFDNNSIL